MHIVFAEDTVAWLAGAPRAPAQPLVHRLRNLRSKAPASASTSSPRLAILLFARARRHAYVDGVERSGQSAGVLTESSAQPGRGGREQDQRRRFEVFVRTVDAFGAIADEVATKWSRGSGVVKV